MADNYTDRFLKMELDFNLFDLRDDQGLPVWDILRYDVNLAYNPFTDKNPHPVKLTAGKLLRGAFMAIGDAIKLRFRNGRVMIFSNSRYRAADGKLYDKASQDVTDSFEHPLIVENKHPLDRYQNPVVQDGLTLYKKFHHASKRLPESCSAEILKAIEDSFGSGKMTREALDSLYGNFFLEYSYYKKLFLRKKPEIVIMTRNGVRKSLIEAAKESGAKVVELQHGRFDRTHLMYSYPEGITVASGLVAPDLFCSFGNYWGMSNMNFPFRNEEVGNSFYAPKKLDVKHDGSLLFISSFIYGEELSRLAIAFSEKHPEVNVTFRLHPNEYYKSDDYVAGFKGCPNIRVTKDEEPIDVAMERCEVVVLIHSTVIYEALSRNKKVASYKRMNYNDLSDCFSNPNVYLVDNEDELYDVLSKETKFCSQSYFEPFDAQKFKSLISNLTK